MPNLLITTLMLVCGTALAEWFFCRRLGPGRRLRWDEHHSESG